MSLDHYGAIDIGTNAARLFIGYVQNRKGNVYVKKVSLIRVPLRLGEDVFATGKISDKKKERFRETLIAFKHLLKAFEVRRFRVCATSAMREAMNGVEVRNYLKNETGINIEIIDGDEEADIIFSNIFMSGYDQSKSYLLIDVGGGSTELTVIRDGERISSRSFPIGTLRILKNGVPEKVWNEVKLWIHQSLDGHQDLQAIGTGGNINKLFKLMEKKSTDLIHVYELESMHRFLSGMSVEDRMEKLKLKPDRADVIAPASLIYLTAMQLANIDRMLVPKTGLADALVFQMHLQDTGILQ